MAAGDPRARRRAARPQPRRREHGRRRGHRAHGRPARRATPASSRSTSSGSARSSTSCSPRALLLANLFRDQLDRYGELDTIADRWAAVAARTSGRARAQRRRPDRRRPRPRRVGATVLRRRGRRDGAARRCSTPPTPSTAGAAARPTSTTPSTSATSAATTATAAGPRAPSRRSAARDIVLEGVRGARFTLRTPAGERAIALPLPGLYNVYNALGAAALALALGATLDEVDAGLHAVAPAFGRAETLRVGGARAVDPARQEPGRRQRGPAHARARGRRARRLRRAQRQHRRRPRRLLGVGRGLRGPRAARAARDVQRHPRRRDGAAPEVRRRARPSAIAVEPDLGARPGPRAARAATAGSSPCPPTPRCSRCATCSSRAARPGLVRMTDGRLWHDIECGGYDADLPLWRELADARGRAGARRRRGHRARGARPRAPRARGRRARPRRRAARRAARARPRGLPVETVRRRRARLRRSDRRFALDHRADADDPAARRRRRAARASCARARAHLAPGGLLAAALADALEALRRRARPSRRCPTCARSTASSTPAARSPCATRRPRARSSACARSWRATARGRLGDDVIELDRVDADELAAEAARRGLRAAAAAARSRRPTSTSAPRW